MFRVEQAGRFTATMRDVRTMEAVELAVHEFIDAATTDPAERAALFADVMDHAFTGEPVQLPNRRTLEVLTKA